MNKNLSRREVLRRAALVLGVSAVSPAIASAVMAGAKADKAAGPRILTAQQLLLVAVLTEMIIPTTSTPGANAAGVHHYIDVLLSDYFSRAHRESFLQGLADVDARARARGFDNFVAASPEHQYQIAVELDKEAYTEPSNGEAQKPSRFFRELKELTLTGYYTSQIGATKELSYDPIPGKYRGCVPYTDVGSAWADWAVS
jgi:gluconate 2-dehydrogenase gamma chain